MSERAQARDGGTGRQKVSVPENRCGDEIASNPESNYKRAMTAATALEKQILLYRRMTGEQRLAVALDLHELSCDIAREGIRRQHPAANAEEVERLLRRRIELSRDA
jgi:hypothetical protein